MNPIANIWRHPRTSAAGVLISLITVAGVLSQQGITLGHAGSGTVVTLIGALAAALLGLLARDPASPAAPPAGNPTTRLGVWAIILLLVPAPWMTACSGSKVAQDIVNWTPALQSAVATVDSTGALLDPADAPIFTAATIGFDAASGLLAAQAKAYLANPGVGTLAQLQIQVTTMQQQVNSALLAAAGIVDPASRQRALATINGVATVVSAILALVQSVSGKAAVAQMAARARVKTAAVLPLLDRRQAAVLVAAHYGESLEAARRQIAAAQTAVLEAQL